MDPIPDILRTRFWCACPICQVAYFTASLGGPYETGLLPLYRTTKNPSPPDVTTTIPDLKKG